MPVVVLDPVPFVGKMCLAWGHPVSAIHIDSLAAHDDASEWPVARDASSITLVDPAADPAGCGTREGS
jgi:hypothetical protein